MKCRASKRTQPRSGTRSAMALGALLFTACDPGFEKASEVGSSKLMGVRLEVEGSPERAWPRVGEAFSLRWLVARAGKPSPLALAEQFDGSLSVCVGTQLPRGTLFCAQEIALDPLNLKGENTVTSFEEIVMPLQVPVDPRSVVGGERILLFGAICVEGKVERVEGKKVGEDPANELYRCIDNDKAALKTPLAFANTITVDFEDDAFAANLNPSFACDPKEKDSICQQGSVHEDEQRRGGAFVLVRPKKEGARSREVTAWPEVVDNTRTWPTEGCATDPRFNDLQIEAGAGEHLVRIRFDKSDRERYDAEELKFNETTVVNKREELLVSHAATRDAVELGRYYSIVAREQSDETAEVELDFKPVKPSSKAGQSIPDDGKVVRFYFVVRDQRGGADFATRSLCLVPQRSP